MTSLGHPTPRTQHRDLRDSSLELGRWAQEASRGGLNNCGSVTLAANAVQTVVTEQFVTSRSGIWLQAITSDAALEVGNGTIYVITNDGNFAINHASNAQTDRIFNWVHFSGAASSSAPFVLAGVFSDDFSVDYL